MKLVAYEDTHKVMVGALSPDGSIAPIGEREAFWRDPGGHLGRADRAASRRLSEVKQVHAVPASARVLCIGLNYRTHALEGGRGEVPTLPVVFGRWTVSLVSEAKRLRRPRATERARSPMSANRAERPPRTGRRRTTACTCR